VNLRLGFVYSDWLCSVLKVNLGILRLSETFSFSIWGQRFTECCLVFLERLKYCRLSEYFVCFVCWSETFSFSITYRIFLSLVNLGWCLLCWEYFVFLKMFYLFGLLKHLVLRYNRMSTKYCLKWSSKFSYRGLWFVAVVIVIKDPFNFLALFYLWEPLIHVCLNLLEYFVFSLSVFIKDLPWVFLTRLFNCQFIGLFAPKSLCCSDLLKCLVR